MKNGWRTRVGDFLPARAASSSTRGRSRRCAACTSTGARVSTRAKARDAWTFEDSRAGREDAIRADGKFWETLHIDLRMVDTSDFIIAYCPTNIYSVGTPHEIALCRQQRKPVLFVSPPSSFPALEELRRHMSRKRDRRGLKLLTDARSRCQSSRIRKASRASGTCRSSAARTSSTASGSTASVASTDGPTTVRSTAREETQAEAAVVGLSRPARARAAAEVGPAAKELREKRRLAPLGSRSATIAGAEVTGPHEEK